ncbi:YjjG family noncanonical pyrimidine nucleotidase [Dokdonia sp. Hel_I_53]|uniref:YjjG family noncanonical pyrimidine nucleotidase n=1 Tax=Dokdonia sp. Hel_I_53 TaxID=1566287 RepID=UPI00119E6886|nr:YjjG family noncanonical pyrimidine nucleotidase [Dokdonia sp. Hel_I_53]
MINIKHVFFDLDHTLWDFDRNSKLAFRKVFEINDLTMPFEDFIEIYVPINKQYWKWYREDRVTKSQLRYGRLLKTFKKLGKPVTDGLIHKLSDDYITYLPENNHLFDGVLELLSYLSEKYSLHIITNGFEEVQQSKIQLSGLSSFFNTITTSENVGVKKPHPKIFQHAIKLANASIENSIMIGDTYEADIVGAQNIKMQSICFNYHKAILPKEVITVNRISDIASHL